MKTLFDLATAGAVFLIWHLLLPTVKRIALQILRSDLISSLISLLLDWLKRLLEWLKELLGKPEPSPEPAFVFSSSTGLMKWNREKGYGDDTIVSEYWSGSIFS